MKTSSRKFTVYFRLCLISKFLKKDKKISEKPQKINYLSCREGKKLTAKRSKLPTVHHRKPYNSIPGYRRCRDILFSNFIIQKHVSSVIWSVYLNSLSQKFLQRQLNEKNLPYECEFPCLENILFMELSGSFI